MDDSMRKAYTIKHRNLVEEIEKKLNCKIVCADYVGDKLVHVMIETNNPNTPSKLIDNELGIELVEMSDEEKNKHYKPLK